MDCEKNKDDMMDCCSEEKKEGEMMCNKCKMGKCEKGKCDKCNDDCEMSNHKDDHKHE